MIELGCPPPQIEISMSPLAFRRTMRIVRAEPSHIDQIMQLWNEFAEYHQRIDPYYWTVEGGDTKFGDYILSIMSQEDAQVLAAMEGGLLLGYCLSHIHQRSPLFTETKVGILSDLAVRADRRGQGTGSALIEESLAWFRAQGVKRVELRTSAMNSQAIELYRKHGFWVYDHIMTMEI
jgi:GNAT superfamily N-acetyltransferase